MDSTAHLTLPNTQSCPRVIVNEQRKLVHLALAELNTEHQECQWRKTGHFVMNGATQENRELILKSPNSNGVLITDYIGQIHKTQWVRGLKSSWELIGGKQGEGN